MKKNIQLFQSYWNKNAIKKVSQIIKRGVYWCDGPEVREFEDAIASFNSRKYAVSFNSGTSALYANLIAHDITFGEVIIPSFSFPATANAVIVAGAKPVFADIELDTFGLSADDVIKRINKNTKAIMPINFAGNISRDIEKLRKIADQNNIPLIEDNAHSFGAKMGGRMAGTFGDSAALSFAFNKILPIGEGGMVITDSAEIAQKLRIFRDNGGNKEAIKRDYISCGLNLGMSSFTAGFGLEQFSDINYLIKKRQEIASYFNGQLKNISEIKLPIIQKGCHSVYQFYNILFKEEKLRDEFMVYMKQKGIPTRITYYPIHLYSYFKKIFHCKEGDLPNTELISKKIVTLPFHLGLKKGDLNYIVSNIEEFFRIQKTLNVK